MQMADEVVEGQIGMRFWSVPQIADEVPEGSGAES